MENVRSPLAAASVRHLCGVQIVDVRWNGRHVRVGVASRLGMCGGMDAMSWSVWRPDWGCEAEWTPCESWWGVQIVD